VVDIDSVTEIIEDVGHVEVLGRFGALDSGDISEKHAGDLVTVADVAAERELTRRLTPLVPGSTVVGEEGVHADAAALEALTGSEPVWVIDPIDGTVNYTRGIPMFAVMVALVVGGRTVAGWIHDPYHRRTAVAEAGSGARLDGRPMQVRSGPRRQSELTGAIYAGKFATPELSAHVHARKAALHPIRTIACAGFEYLRLAGGGTDFALFTRTMPWDHLPGILIHAEAGGWTRRIDHSAYLPARPGGPALLIASDEPTWSQVHQALIGDWSEPG
jgi:fructose-1,6-bisphosphatase/inositol monophosphatase family enzyme